MTDTERTMRRNAHALCAQWGLDRDDRLALAEMLLKRDCTSWDQLDEAEIRRVLDALNGFHYVAELLRQSVTR